MEISWDKLLKLEYWFEGIAGGISITTPLEEGGKFFWFFLWFFVVIFALGVFIRISQSFLDINHPLQLKLPNWGNNVIWISIWGTIWFLCRQLGVGFLGARFWLIVLGIWFLILLYFVIKYFIQNFKYEIMYFQKTKAALPIKK